MASQRCDPTTIGELIRRARAERTVTAADLADAIGITASHLAAIERGDRSATPTIVRRATAHLAHLEFTGAMLTAAMDRRFLTVGEIATQLDISHSHVANLRSGLRRFTAEMVDRLISVAAIRPDDLIAPPEDGEAAA